MKWSFYLKTHPHIPNYEPDYYRRHTLSMNYWKLNQEDRSQITETIMAEGLILEERQKHIFNFAHNLNCQKRSRRFSQKLFTFHGSGNVSGEFG